MKYRTVYFPTLLERTKIPLLKTLAAQPGMKVLYRVIAYYLDGRARHSVATLYGEAGKTDFRLEVVYEGVNQHKPMLHSIRFAHYEALTAAFLRANFDKRVDQEVTIQRLHTLWMVERAAGTFHHSVIFTPQQPELPYSIIVNALDAYLSEAIREVVL